MQQVTRSPVDAIAVAATALTRSAPLADILLPLSNMHPIRILNRYPSFTSQSHYHYHLNDLIALITITRAVRTGRHGRPERIGRNYRGVVFDIYGPISRGSANGAKGPALRSTPGTHDSPGHSRLTHSPRAKRRDRGAQRVRAPGSPRSDWSRSRKILEMIERRELRGVGKKGASGEKRRGRGVRGVIEILIFIMKPKTSESASGERRTLRKQTRLRGTRA